MLSFDFPVFCSGNYDWVCSGDNYEEEVRMEHSRQYQTTISFDSTSQILQETCMSPKTKNYTVRWDSNGDAGAEKPKLGTIWHKRKQMSMHW